MSYPFRVFAKPPIAQQAPKHRQAGASAPNGIQRVKELNLGAL